MNFMNYGFNPRNEGSNLVAPVVTRLSHLEDAKLRIGSLMNKPRCSINPGLILEELLNITDLHQTGTIGMVDYIVLLYQLRDLRKEAGLNGDGQAARDEFERYGLL
jgi:hypothetical protein